MGNCITASPLTATMQNAGSEQAVASALTKHSSLFWHLIQLSKRGSQGAWIIRVTTEHSVRHSRWRKQKGAWPYWACAQQEFLSQTAIMQYVYRMHRQSPRKQTGMSFHAISVINLIRLLQSEEGQWYGFKSITWWKLHCLSCSHVLI